jgi:adenylate cyclase
MQRRIFLKVTIELNDSSIRKADEAAKALGISTDKLMSDVIDGYFDRVANAEQLDMDMIQAFDARTVGELLPKYVCHRCVNKVLEYNEKGTFGGEESPMTIMFIDIRGFTTMSEKIGPEDAMRVLNSNYYVVVETVMLKYNGAILKFIGDGMLCAFGMPESGTDDAVEAIRCAVELQREIRDLQRAQDADKRIKIGIGIHSGNVIMGNIGHPKRLDFTVIGDPVNLAARLEDKARSDEILVTEDTLELVSDKSIQTEFIENFLPKGKTRPIKIHKVIWD